MLAGVLALGGIAAWPVIGQEPSPAAEEPPAAPPRSLLPEGFDAPVVESATPDAAPDAAGVAGAPPRIATTAPPLLLRPVEPAEEEAVDPFDVPQASGRPIDVAGPLGGGVTGTGAGYGPLLFQGSDGAFVAALMRRIAAPPASRWAAIVLRRALLTEAAAPARIAPADWLAERAALLLRLGDIDGAKALVDWAPVDRYSPRLYRVAGQVSLAAADLAGLCPIAETGAELSRDAMWPLARAMCAGMEGDDITAARLLDQLRKEERVDEFDILLAERVASISGGGGRAANVDWELADRLTPFRYGVAVAASLSIPDGLLATLGAAGAPGWQARAAALPEAQRLGASRVAAAQGVVSVGDLAGALAFGDASDADAAAGRLRTASAGTRIADRLVALRAIWTSETGALARYGALIETARAAARLPVSADTAGDAPEIVGALLAAGMDRAAARWASAPGDEASRMRTWALLAAGGPDGTVRVDAATFEAWLTAERGRDAAGADGRARLLLAALDGLERGGTGFDGIREELGLGGLDNRWTRALAAAARAGRTGEVATLAAIGLQGGWAAVPAQHLRAITAAYRAVGRGFEARMLAAEAVTRG